MDLPSLLSNAFERHAGQLALRAEGLSYARLDELTRGLAAWLRTRCDDGDRVLIVGEHTAEAVTWALATLRSGLVYTPLNPALPDARCEEAVRLANPGLIVCFDAEVRARIVGTGRPVVLAREVVAPDSPLVGAVGRVAYSIFTSGSTGSPKLVDVGHDGLDALCRAQAETFDLRPGQRVLQFSSLSFDASIAELLVTLFAGATLDIPAWRGGSWLEAVDRHLRRHGSDLITLPPSVYARLSDAAITTLTTVVFAGEPLTEAEFRRAAAHSRVFNAYGPTEGTVCFSIAEVREFGTSIGRPIRGYTALIHRGGGYHDEGRGELVLLGPGVALGYEGEQGKPGFVELPAGRAYHTGDEVELAGGELHYLGRLDDQVKRLGHRIVPADVEHRLTRLLGTRVIVVADGSSLLLAHEDPELPELRTLLASQLPPWEIPDRIVHVPEFPLTLHGKTDRAALLAQMPRPAPGDGVVDDIVERVLGARIGATTSIFDAGGDSLSLVRIQAELIAVFGEEPVRTALAELDFDFTIGGFLAQLDTGSAEPESVAARVFRTVTAELRTWELEPGSADPDGALVLTGVSGFLGGHLLDRALGTGRAIRVITTGDPADVVAKHCTRFTRTPADLAEVEFLGYEDLPVTDSWGSVVHCGYDVNHLLPLEKQLAHSVAATVSLVRAAAAAGTAHFSFLSTASVGPAFLPFSADALAAIEGPYSQSKFVCEAYVEALSRTGCVVDIHRCGLVYGHSATELAFARRDTFANLVGLAVRLGIFPRFAGHFPLSEVDYVADTVLADLDGPGTRRFLIERTYDAAQVRAELGLELTGPEHWLRTAERSGLAAPTMLAAVRDLLTGAGWPTPIRTGDRPLLRRIRLPVVP